MKSWVVLLSSLLLAVLTPLMVLGSSGCGRDADTLENQVWTKHFATPGDEYDYANDVIVDASGNIYVAGFTTGTFPGQTSSGSGDGFVGKYDASGNEIWVRQFDTGGGFGVQAMVADGSGSIYLACGGASVSKYDTLGNEVWTRQFGDVHDGVNAMVADGSGNIYVAGETAGTSSSGQTPPGWVDAFIAKYDGSWNEVWRRQFVTTSDYGGVKAMVADGSGNICVAGNTRGTSGPGYPDMSDAFVAKYDSSGNEVWMRKFGPTLGLDHATAMVADGSGNIYVAGNNVPTMVEDTLRSSGGAFMAKYDSSGNEVWTTQPGTMGDLCAYAVIVDGSGNIYVAGDTTGSRHASIAKYDTSGNEVWRRQLRTRGVLGIKAMVADGSGNIYLAGYDAFIMKIRE